MKERAQPEVQSGEMATGSPPVSRSEALAKPYARRPANEPSALASDSSSRSRPSVELHIEELVLNGFNPADRYRIGEAVERELTRLLTEQGTPITTTQNVEIAHLNGGAINVKPGSNTEATGIQLARAIYGGLGK